MLNNFLEFIPKHLRNNPEVHKALMVSLKKADTLYKRGSLHDVNSKHFGKEDVYYLLRALNFNNPPRIVKINQFEKLYDTGKYLRLYRGMASPKWVDNFKFKNNNFVGTTNEVTGIWATSNIVYASSYAGENPAVEFLYPKDIKIFSGDLINQIIIDNNELNKIKSKIEKKIKEYYDNNDKENGRRLTFFHRLLLNNFFMSNSIQLLMQGYEAVKYSSSSDVYIIFNRSKIIIHSNIYS